MLGKLVMPKAVSMDERCKRVCKYQWWGLCYCAARLREVEHMSAKP